MVFDEKWFIKHQKILLWFCNTPLIKEWFRYILRIKGKSSGVGKRKIKEIAPNYITWSKGKKNYYEFRTHDKYAKRLYYSLYPLWSFFHIWDLLADPFLPRLSFGFSTFTFNPDTGTGSTTCDASIQRNNTSGDTFANVRNSANADTCQTGATSDSVCRLLAFSTSNNWQLICRGGFGFNTASLSGKTIDTATIGFFGTSKVDNFSQSVVVVSFSPSTNNSFVVGDFTKTKWGETSFGSVVGSAWSTSSYNTISLNASGISNISLSGVSNFGVRTSADQSNTEPTWAISTNADYEAYYADQAGTNNDPILTVVEVVTSSGVITPFFLRSLQ